MNMRKCCTDSSFKLVVSSKLEGKIRYLCDRFPNTEWSGIMFYKEQPGSLENKDLVLIAEDFYLLDVGTAGYTEYEVTPDVLSYQIENDLLHCWWSLLHSHNNFACFFSGTDTNTLNKIGETMNHCVSLIVNNAGQYVARMTRVVDEKYNCDVDCFYKSFNDEEKEFKYDFKANRKNLEYIDAKIEVSEPDKLSEDEIEFLETRIDDIATAKEEARKSKIDEAYSHFGIDGKFDYGDMFDDDYAYSFEDDYKRPKDSVSKEAKKFVYSLITGDLFPMACVVNRSVSSVISDAMKIYNVKKRTINKTVCENQGLEGYVDYIVNYYVPYGDMDGMLENAISTLMEYSEGNIWIEKLYQILVMYGN